MIAGSIGGAIGDLAMYSIDTVKTRQQGAPGFEQFSTLRSTYTNILKNEGVVRGLYAGIFPAMVGCIPGTAIFFGAYEALKRLMLSYGLPDTICHLTAGLTGDLAASVVYVPSEVLKTRLQLQGQFNNPHFNSGFNYRSTLHACKTIVNKEGPSALFHGYKATLFRDLPFSALQFAFYERFKILKDKWRPNESRGSVYEMASGFLAGALAGGLTTPFDVVKTRIQTQNSTLTGGKALKDIISLNKAANQKATFSSVRIPRPKISRPVPNASSNAYSSGSHGHTVQKLSSHSVIRNLVSLFRYEGTNGLFRGVLPRSAWTGCQSGLLFVFYETILRYLESNTDTILTIE